MNQLNKSIYFLISILSISITLGQDCEAGSPDWPSNNDIAPGYEFSFYITAQIFIDGMHENGKIAGFVGDQIRGTDIDGSSYFPPSDTWLYQFPIYSNQIQGETISFKFYDETNNLVINLNETLEFISDGIVGDAFNPVILTGSTINCQNNACVDLSNINFGDCEMILGIGWNGFECEYFSGCDWIVDDIDYSDYFFDSWQGCEEICSSNNGCNLTTDDILGPYYFEDAPYRNVLAQEEEPGERLFISGLVKQNNCEFSISGSLIEIWHANDEGCYGIVEDCDTGNPEDDYFNLRGKFFSDENGNYTFESILPGYYASRPRHIHIKITTPSEEILVSQLYFEDDPLCESDPWCQDADGRIISLEENEFGLYGEINIIMDSSESGIILGDINFDTSLNIQDIVLLVGIIIGNVNPNDFQIYAGDINIDYIINVLDILQLTNIILNN